MHTNDWLAIYKTNYYPTPFNTHSTTYRNSNRRDYASSIAMTANVTVLFSQHGGTGRVHDGDTLGNSNRANWPLPNGRYVVVLFAAGGYTALAVSQPFDVFTPVEDVLLSSYNLPRHDPPEVRPSEASVSLLTATLWITMGLAYCVTRRVDCM